MIIYYVENKTNYKYPKWNNNITIGNLNQNFDKENYMRIKFTYLNHQKNKGEKQQRIQGTACNMQS